jgi:hypothetical protein
MPKGTQASPDPAASIPKEAAHSTDSEGGRLDEDAHTPPEPSPSGESPSPDAGRAATPPPDSADEAAFPQRKKKKGGWPKGKKRGPRKKPGEGPSFASTPKTDPSDPTPKIELGALVVDTDKAAATLVSGIDGIVVGLSGLAFGSEYGPGFGADDDAKAAMQGAWKGYLDSGGLKLTPGQYLGLCLAMGYGARVVVTVPHVIADKKRRRQGTQVGATPPPAEQSDTIPQPDETTA